MVNSCQQISVLILSRARQSRPLRPRSQAPCVSPSMDMVKRLGIGRASQRPKHRRSSTLSALAKLTLAPALMSKSRRSQMRRLKGGVKILTSQSPHRRKSQGLEPPLVSQGQWAIQKGNQARRKKRRKILKPYRRRSAVPPALTQPWCAQLPVHHMSTMTQVYL